MHIVMDNTFALCATTFSTKAEPALQFSTGLKVIVDRQAPDCTSGMLLRMGCRFRYESPAPTIASPPSCVPEFGLAGKMLRLTGVR